MFKLPSCVFIEHLSHPDDLLTPVCIRHRRSGRFLHTDVINSVIITEIRVEISKISMLFFSNVIFVQTSDRSFNESSYIKSFWIKGWGNRNIDNDKCAKIQIFSYIRILIMYTCCSFKINYYLRECK